MGAVYLATRASEDRPWLVRWESLCSSCCLQACSPSTPPKPRRNQPDHRRPPGRRPLRNPERRASPPPPTASCSPSCDQPKDTRVPRLGPTPPRRLQPISCLTRTFYDAHRHRTHRPRPTGRGGRPPAPCRGPLVCGLPRRSHSHGLGRVSSKSLMSHINCRSGEVSREMFSRCASPHSWAVIPETGPAVGQGCVPRPAPPGSSAGPAEDPPPVLVLRPSWDARPARETRTEGQLSGLLRGVGRVDQRCRVGVCSQPWALISVSATAMATPSAVAMLPAAVMTRAVPTMGAMATRTS